MKEERMAILKMVAEGKITADEAETLLQALGRNQPEQNQGQGQRRRHERRNRGRRSWNWPVDVEHIVEDTVGFVDDVVESFEKEFSFFDKEFDSSPQTLQVSPGTMLVVKANSGSVNLIGTDAPELQISGAVRWHYKVEQEKQVIQVRAKHFGASLTIHVPATITRLVIKSHLGQVIGRNLSNQLTDIQVKSQTGNIALELGKVTTGRIMLKSQVGGVKLRLPQDSTADIKAATHHMGDIQANLPLTMTERGSGYLKGTLNGGGADIRLVTHTGGILIEAS